MSTGVVSSAESPWAQESRTRLGERKGKGTGGWYTGSCTCVDTFDKLSHPIDFLVENPVSGLSPQDSRPFMVPWPSFSFVWVFQDIWGQIFSFVVRVFRIFEDSSGFQHIYTHRLGFVTSFLQLLLDTLSSGGSRVWLVTHRIWLVSKFIVVFPKLCLNYNLEVGCLLTGLEEWTWVGPTNESFCFVFSCKKYPKFVLVSGYCIICLQVLY